jgi:hypothetical protein
MRLELTKVQAQELEALLDATIRELSHEIAATDNAKYRAHLMERRTRLGGVREAIAGSLAPVMEPTQDIESELAHPGG